MDWDDLRFVLAIGRAGSVPGAARALGVAHTTVYRRLDALETRYGAPLFDRSSGACAATDAGRALIALAEDVEGRLVGFERRLAGRDQALAGSVTVATVEPIAVELTRHLVALRRAHPAIQVHLHVTDAFVDLSRHEADLALRATREPPEDLVGQRVVFRTSSRAAFVEIVAAGAAMGVLPCGLAGDLVPLTEPIAALRLPLWLLAHPDLASSPRIRVVRGFLLAAFEGRRPALEGEGVRPR